MGALKWFHTKKAKLAWHGLSQQQEEIRNISRLDKKNVKRESLVQKKGFDFLNAKNGKTDQWTIWGSQEGRKKYTVPVPTKDRKQSTTWYHDYCIFFTKEHFTSTPKNSKWWLYLKFQKVHLSSAKMLFLRLQKSCAQRTKFMQRRILFTHKINFDENEIFS